MKFKYWLSVTIFALSTALFADSLVFPARNFPRSSLQINRSSAQARGLTTVYNAASGQYRNYGRIGNILPTSNIADLAVRPEMGRMFRFTETNSDFMALDDSDVLFPSNDSWSITIWYRHRTGSVVDAIVEYLFSTVRTGQVGSSALDLEFLASTGKLFFNIHNGTGFVSVDGPTLSSLGIDWHLFSATYDGTIFRWFVDTAEQTSITDSHSGFSSSDAKLGVNAAGNNRFFPGDIGELRIYDWPIPDGLVRQIYNPDTRFELWESPKLFVRVPDAAVIPCFRLLMGVGC